MNNQIKVTPVLSNENVADIMTKPLSSVRFQDLRSSMSLVTSKAITDTPSGACRIPDSGASMTGLSPDSETVTSDDWFDGNATANLSSLDTP